MQFLLESLILCCVAGVTGLLLGFGLHESIIYAASKFSDKVDFVWFIEPETVTIAFVGIFIIGIANGLFPALKAEKLDVIEAMKSE